jgi:DNA-binding response OmpR family regulator
MSNALLLAEPEEETRGYLERQLREDGFEVVPALDGEVLGVLEQERPDLVLLGDPASSELCRRLREGEPGRTWDRAVPVIVLGDSDADSVDRVRAFDRGCDDYLPRPIVYEELLARIRAILRRTTPQPGDRLEAAEIVIDRPTRHVTVAGTTVPLPTKEYELLVKLASEPLRVFTKEQLLRDVWDFRSLGRTRTLDSHASRLRRKLAEHATKPYVVNEWGVGYRLMAPL